jgi:hypothetical protein
VIVRATHDLHVNQHKTQNQIQTFLKDDCQKLGTKELAHKVKHNEFLKNKNRILFI